MCNWVKEEFLLDVEGGQYQAISWLQTYTH